MLIENRRHEYDRTMLVVNDYIHQTCDGKTECFIEIPNWTAVNGTTQKCREREPTIQNFHLRGVYLDIGCSFRKLYVRTPTNLHVHQCLQKLKISIKLCRAFFLNLQDVTSFDLI